MTTRRDKDDALLAEITAELDAYESATGKTVNVSIDDSVAAGNCREGVVAWRAKNAGGRESVPAREMLQLAAANRDQVSRVVLGVRKALKRARGA
jgi:post-segregation antitoxin (ccd killing protein)